MGNEIAARAELEVFHKLLEDGSIQKPYRAILDYMMSLRTYFQKNFEGATVSGLYQGHLDMTYFALFPPALKARKLKIAVVFSYEDFRFEVWLSGSNRKVQNHYWELIDGGDWPKYRVIAPGTWVDSILEWDLASGYELVDPEALTDKLEAGVKAFCDDIERFLSSQ